MDIIAKSRGGCSDWGNKFPSGGQDPYKKGNKNDPGVTAAKEYDCNSMQTANDKEAKDDSILAPLESSSSSNTDRFKSRSINNTMAAATIVRNSLFSQWKSHL